MSRELVVEKELEIRFSEVDMMGVVWHGNYPLYLEDAREAFGAEFGLSYALYIKENVFVPIVKMDVDYKRPVRFGMRPVIRIEYVPTDAAKVIFDYKLYDKESGDVFLTARTVQVFMDRDYKLMWFSPDFYTQWKRQMGLTE
ncbi:MAG: acyl-CoA thioesterase [Bacteroidales bacterium]|nr:acyl-CoA thioesterase [Rikenellaceae bacterium]MDD6976434.1 acyl-CoA thioesterase [Bacteroidales bacterium]MDY4916075.1 acyl-CoA thioesterase [Candidatus Cryptobacteroides sp.]MDY6171156.1 acyl-CoA thioesterase [Candidatus Cryptobacteroides sp.]